LKPSQLILLRILKKLSDKWD